VARTPTTSLLITPSQEGIERACLFLAPKYARPTRFVPALPFVFTCHWFLLPASSLLLLLVLIAISLQGKDTTVQESADVTKKFCKTGE
jgi:hypothetical protein